ncbi:hypothetical protein N7G274_006686 [Stereocaulon virgatum]|uniref:Uncharacterized protein n=1 Tax=Stereocaulon virgatum TaxID=373712 RepID=A0ABR4A474_9LECA
MSALKTPCQLFGFIRGNMKEVLYELSVFGFDFSISVTTELGSPNPLRSCSIRIERPLGQGRKRIRWRCRCGRKLYDDFTELRRGAANELERRLNEGGSRVRCRNPGQEYNAGQPPGEIANLATGLPISSVSQRRRSLSSTLSPPMQRLKSGLGEYPEAPAPPRPEDLFLLLCIPHRKRATKLVHMDVCTVFSD